MCVFGRKRSRSWPLSPSLKDNAIMCLNWRVSRCPRTTARHTHLMRVPENIFITANIISWYVLFRVCYFSMDFINKATHKYSDINIKIFSIQGIIALIQASVHLRIPLVLKNATFSADGAKLYSYLPTHICIDPISTVAFLSFRV